MRPLDYGRSFVLGNGPENEVRMWVESRTRITDERTGASEDYIQTGSCKSEDVFVERNLFKEPNYDFMAIYGPRDAIVFRRLAHAHEGYRSRVPSADFFGGQRYHLVEGGEVVELEERRRRSAPRPAPAIRSWRRRKSGTTKPGFEPSSSTRSSR